MKLLGFSNTSEILGDFFGRDSYCVDVTMGILLKENLINFFLAV